MLRALLRECPFPRFEGPVIMVRFPQAVTGLAAALVTSFTAHAADLSMTPIYKARPSAAAPAWSGSYYLGAAAGTRAKASPSGPVADVYSKAMDPPHAAGAPLSDHAFRASANGRL